MRKRDRGDLAPRPARGSGRIRVHVRAKAPEAIRCTKLLVRGLPAPLAWVDESGVRPIGPWGESLAYPNRLGAPLICLRAGDETFGVRAEDTRVREKRFAAAVERGGERAGQGVLEVICEEEATHRSHEFEAPPCVLMRGIARESLLAQHEAFASDAYNLVPWAARRNVPAWAHELKLVLTLHGMHWTGRVFLDYSAMQDVLHLVTDRLPGRHVLAYLPGWEGRYYWQYGDYRPDPRLGGERGFAKLCEFARERQAHVMPMFGGNCVNHWLHRFRDLDPAPT